MTRLNGVNLSGADLSKAHLHLAELKGVNLSSADLKRTKLNGADLSQADLNNADLSQAGLSNVDLSDADLRGTNLNKAYLNNANFSGTKLGIINLVRYNLEVFWKNLNALPMQGYHTFDVKIFDTQLNQTHLENLKSTIELFISSTEYEIVATIQSVNASFLQDIRYKVTPSLAPEIINEGVKAKIKCLQRKNSQIESLEMQSSQWIAQATGNS